MFKNGIASGVGLSSQMVRFRATALPMAPRHIVIGYSVETRSFIIREAIGSAYHWSGRI